jgi:hypothetical protein
MGIFIMSLYIDRKYILLISPKLNQFKQKSENLFNCRCPVCGDSEKVGYRARGYFHRVKNSFLYKCHNCTISWPLWKFLKFLDRTLYEEYQLECFKENTCGNTIQTVARQETQKTKSETRIIDLPSIDSLSENHFAKQYVMNRRIPKSRWSDLYYADDFKKFVDETMPNHNKELKVKEQRLIIPFFDQKNIFQGLQGRAFGESKVRYITIRAREDMIKVFGLNKVDFTKPIYVVEGPIDSLFLNNSVATMDSALYRVASILGDYDYVFVYDNEKRNKEVCKLMNKTIENGHKIVIWPSNIEQKDVNDMVLAGLDPQKIISERTFQGPKAKLEFEMWRKV